MEAPGRLFGILTTGKVKLSWFFQCGRVWGVGVGGVSSFKEAKRLALTPYFVGGRGWSCILSPNMLSRTLASSTRLTFLSETD